MGPLDKARLQKLINTILEGDWKGLLSTDTFLDLTDWFHAHRDKKEVAVRFTFFEELGTGSIVKHAMHFECSPKIIDKKILIREIYLADDDNLLALPPDLYEVPLFCIPDSMDDLFDNMD